MVEFDDFDDVDDVLDGEKNGVVVCGVGDGCIRGTGG